MIVMSNAWTYVGLFFVVFWLQLLSQSSTASAIELQTMNAPKYLIVGHSAQLSCNLSGVALDKLYSVRWYGPGRFNFYRYRPNLDTPIMVFPARGFKVNQKHSSPLIMVLTNITREAAGLYTCEVTVPPDYFTVAQSRQLKVIDLPDSPPVIRGYQTFYQAGDQLVAVCVSERSHPKVDLQWFINQDPVELWHNVQVKNSVTQQENNLTTTYSKLVHTVDSKPDRLAIRCLAMMPEFGYMEETEVSVSVRPTVVVGARVGSVDCSSPRHSTTWLIMLVMFLSMRSLT